MTATRAPDGVRSVPSREEHDRSEGRIAFPLRVGVTGHRDLHDPAAVRKAVRTELSKLRDLFPETAVTTVRFTLLSSLAEGADRLVLDEAREALPEHRLVLHAVLPMERDEYRKDFATDACREDFDRLLDGAAQITTLPATADRDQAYEHAGTWIVEHSDAVIAVWDGRPAAGRGGTAEIARHARVQGVPVIVVPAARDGDPQRAPHPVAWATDVAGVPLDAAREAYARTDEFNRGSVRDNRLRGPIDRLETQLSGAAEGSAVHWLYEIVAEWALPRLARADMLAMRYQRRYYRLGEALYAFAALAVTAIAFQSEARLDDQFALLEVVCMVLLLLMLWTARRARVHGRWMGYRSLAEAFRSALFIALTGAEVRTNRPPTSLAPVEEPWFQRTFSEAWSTRPVVKLDPSATADLRLFITEAWIGDQVAYHRRAVERFERGRRRLTRSIEVLFGLTLLIGIVHSFALVEGEDLVRSFVFLAIALPGFGAALTGVRDQRQYRVHEERSRRAASRLLVLKRNMELQTNLQSVRTLAAQIQTVIEAENLDWSGVIEFQDLEMVV